MVANNIQYYLNQGEPCPPMSGGGCLQKNNYLSEFQTQEEKEVALENLGVQDIVQELVDDKIGRLVESMNRLWGKIGEMTGDVFEGIVFHVNPRYYIGEGKCLVHVTANTGSFQGVFERLQLYINDEKEPRINQRNVGYVGMDIEIQGTTTLTCKATMSGITYTESRKIVNYEPAWMWSGQSAEDAESIMTLDHLISIRGKNPGKYSINFNQNDKLIVVIGGKQSTSENVNPLFEDFLTADMGGGRFDFEWQDIQINGEDYCVGVSVNTYPTGTYDIFVNS